MKHARCASCRNFYLLSHLAKATCPACVYETYRCDECGGVEGTQRSIRAHFAWYRTRGKETGGHSSALAAKARILRPKAKLQSGGVP